MAYGYREMSVDAPLQLSPRIDELERKVALPVKDKT
jgi:hypothetical protein